MRHRPWQMRRIPANETANQMEKTISSSPDGKFNCWRTWLKEGKKERNELGWWRSTSNSFVYFSSQSINPFLPYLIVPFTEEFELLCFLVHEYSIQVARLNWSNFDRFVAPAHDLTRRDVRCKGNKSILSLSYRTHRHYWAFLPTARARSSAVCHTSTRTHPEIHTN